MAIFTHLETDTGTNADISSATAVGSYTATADKLVMVDVSIDAVAGGGDYVMYVTRQINGSGSAYRILPQTTMAAASGLTAISAQSGWITVRNGDVLTCYVDGLAGDTSTPDWTTRWYELAGVTAAAVADAVLDEATSGHTSAGSFSKAVTDILADTGTDGVKIASGELSTVATASSITALDGKIDTIDNFIDTEIAAIITHLTDIKGAGWSTETLAAIDVLIDAIKAKTDNLPADPADDSDIDAQLAAIKAETALIVEDTGTTIPATLANLALEATLTAMKGAGWTDETLVALMDAIEAITAGSGATAQEVWEYVTRTLTNPDSYKADVSALATTAHVQEVEDKVDAIPFVDTSAVANNVWAYPARSLTVSSVRPRTLVDGDQFSIYKDTSITIPITNLGDISDYTNFWFTVKREQDLEAADAQSIIHMDYLTGLLYINKTAAIASQGSITIDNSSLGNITVAITKDGAALLPIFAKELLRWEIKGLSSSAADILLQGTCYILPAVTRKIT